MKLSQPSLRDADHLIALYEETFAQSEGLEEGAVIGELVRKLLATTKPADLHAFVASDDESVTACTLYTRMFFDEDARTTFLLSPVAVRTDQQGKGIGQKLIQYGLDGLREQGVDVVLTYGDPAFYRKTGFLPIDESVVVPPMPLSLPHGWLGQALTDRPLRALRGPSRCVEAFDDPRLW